MRNLQQSLILLSLPILSSCTPSAQTVQTAIAFTQAAWTATPPSTPALSAEQIRDQWLSTAYPGSTSVVSDAGSDCYRWDAITPAMKGQTVCVRGIIASLGQSRQVGTRYQFSDQPNTFFVFSAYMEIYDPATGGTLGPGTCIELTRPVRVQSGIPYMSLDDEGSRIPGPVKDMHFYDEPSACQ
mgnify:CR=1 FL=1